MKCILLVLGILITQLTSAQVLQDRSFYLKTGGSIGNYPGGEISLEYISITDYSFSLAICGQGRRFRDLPDDYIPPSGVFGWMSMGLDYPREERTTYYFTLGKVLSKKNDKIRFNLKGGLGLNNLRYPADFRKIAPDSTAENYSYRYLSTNRLALVVNPTIDIAVWKYAGISTGFSAIISPNRSSFAFQITLMFGLLR